MIILSMDLTSANGSLAIRIDGKTAAQLELESPEGFAHLIYPAVDAVLQQASITLQDVDCFATASGPGAFTGVRVGITAVKGLAFALDRKVCGVSNLRALSLCGTKHLRAVMLDARRGDIFGAVYDEHACLIIPETVTKFSTWMESLPSGDYDFITNSDVPGAEHFLCGPSHLAEGVAVCAERDASEAKWLDPAALDANYVRRSDAELFWKDQS